jgi:hypothetical protein
MAGCKQVGPQAEGQGDQGGEETTQDHQRIKE